MKESAHTAQLEEALERPPSRRRAFLARACGDDAALKQELESLIRADEAAGDFLAAPILAGGAQPVPPVREPEGRFLPLTVVANRYRLVRLIGRGGMGEVYLADDLKLGEPVALKFLPESLAQDPDIQARLFREVKIARRVTHLNVCRVYDVVEADGHHFISMEYIDGEDLASVLRTSVPPGRREAIEILRQICCGLAAVHRQGILHCDLKPANVLVDREGDVRITDFGISELVGRSEAATVRRGTPSYMAPEQHAREEVTVRTDLYALGLVMYKVLTGQPVFRAEFVADWARLHREVPPVPPSKLVADLDPAVERVILQCLSKDPRDRPTSVEDVMRALGDGPQADHGSRSEGAPIGPPVHQLPPPPADFTGRESELLELRTAVESGGVTISGLQGMGGVGKTALALKFAEELAPNYPDAQIYLDLKGASPQPLTPAQAMAHVIHAFHPEAQLPEAESGLTAHYWSVLYGKRALLLMDNTAGSEQVASLLPPRSCFLLVTSRRTFALPGLRTRNLGSLPPEDARAFLRCLVPWIGDEDERIAELCGYLPLALRLAGGTLAERRDLSPAEYAGRLAEGKGRLELIKASLTLSYELLTAEQQRCWRALAVFPGSFDRSAALAVAGLGDDQMGDVLGDLVKNGLAEWTDGRYRLHDLARVFSDDCLGKAERFDAQLRHARHFKGILRKAEVWQDEGGDGILRGLDLLDAVWSDILADRAWLEAHAADDLALAELCSDYLWAGGRILCLRVPAPMRVRWQETALAASRRVGDRSAQVHHLAYLGWARASAGEPTAGIRLCTQSLKIAGEIGYLEGQRISLLFLGSSCVLLGEHRRSIEMFERALTLSRRLANRRSEGLVLCSLGEVYFGLGDLSRALEILKQSLSTTREVGDRYGEGTTLGDLGAVYLELGEPTRALEFIDQCLVTARGLGNRYGEAMSLCNMADAYTDLGDPHRAIELAEQGMSIGVECGRRRLEAIGLFRLGRARMVLGDKSRAMARLEQSRLIFGEMGARDGVSKVAWYLGLLHEEAGDLDRAGDLMQLRVDYERSIGHAEADANATRVEEIRARARPRGLGRG